MCWLMLECDCVILIWAGRSQCKGTSNGSYLYGSTPFGSGMSGGIYPGGAGATYGSYPQSYSQEYQYSTPFQSAAASTSAYYGHSPASAPTYYYNPSPSTSSTTPTTYGSASNPPIPGKDIMIFHTWFYSLPTSELIPFFWKLFRKLGIFTRRR